MARPSRLARDAVTTTSDTLTPLGEFLDGGAIGSAWARPQTATADVARASAAALANRYRDMVADSQASAPGAAADVKRRGALEGPRVAVQIVSAACGGPRAWAVNSGGPRGPSGRS